jgi:PAS domain S-box-containing protein
VATNRSSPQAVFPDDDRFRMLVEASPAGVLLVDARGRIVLVNSAVETWFGYRREELIGQPVEVLVPEGVRPQHAQWRDQYMAQPRVRPMGVNRDLHARRKDGSLFPCDISLHPLLSGDEWQVMVHLVDTTERRRVEAEWRQQESHRRLRFIVEHLPAGAVYVRENALVVNRATEELTGYRRDELTTVQAWFQRLFRERAADMLAEYEADRAEFFPHTRTLELIRSDGEPRWAEFAAYRDEQHEVWLLHDVTARMRAQEQLVQGERLAAIGQMMTALAHESRNALQRAQACLEMLELDLEGRPELLGLARRAQSAVDELQRLYEEVRGYAAPLGLDLQPTNLRELWEQVWSDLAAVRGDRPIKFFSQGVASPEALVDRHRFAQVLRNIFENSLAVLADEGWVCIDVREAVCRGCPAWRLAVRDNGPGLNAVQRARIFEPFFTTKARGTGLGMAIARRVMEAHGGEIAVGTEGPGAEIVLLLPKHCGKGA